VTGVEQRASGIVSSSRAAATVSPRQLVKQEERLIDPAKRLPIFKKLLTIYANDVPYLSLYSPDVVAAVSSKLSRPTFNALTAFTGTWPLELEAK
jgi:hypothetical protein